MNTKKKSRISKQELARTLQKKRIEDRKKKFQSSNKKEMKSIGFACVCIGKMHPDPRCPLHCGDRIR